MFQKKPGPEFLNIWTPCAPVRPWREAIQGWGFDRYVLKQLGPMAGTLMAPPPDAPMVERFVSLGGDPYLVRYNSRLPLVVYVPNGVAVRYRIWHADPEAKPVPEG